MLYVCYNIKDDEEPIGCSKSGEVEEDQQDSEGKHVDTSDPVFVSIYISIGSNGLSSSIILKKGTGQLGWVGWCSFELYDA